MADDVGNRSAALPVCRLRTSRRIMRVTPRTFWLNENWKLQFQNRKIQTVKMVGRLFQVKGEGVLGGIVANRRSQTACLVGSVGLWNQKFGICLDLLGG